MPQTSSFSHCYHEIKMAGNFGHGNRSINKNLKCAYYSTLSVMQRQLQFEISASSGTFTPINLVCHSFYCPYNFTKEKLKHEENLLQSNKIPAASLLGPLKIIQKETFPKSNKTIHSTLLKASKSELELDTTLVLFFKPFWNTHPFNKITALPF